MFSQQQITSAVLAALRPVARRHREGVGTSAEFVATATNCAASELLRDVAGLETPGIAGISYRRAYEYAHAYARREIVEHSPLLRRLLGPESAA